MTDDGVSECLGSFLIIAILLILAAGVSVYVMGITDDSIPIDNPPKYAYITAEIIPALSAKDVWEADSVKIECNAAQAGYRNASSEAYIGTEKIKFILNDPNGNSHEAIQSISMKDKLIEPGAIFYFYTTSESIDGNYTITNQYERIGDGNSIDSEGFDYPKPFKKGLWQVILVDDVSKTIIGNKKVIIT